MEPRSPDAAPLHLRAARLAALSLLVLAAQATLPGNGLAQAASVEVSPSQAFVTAGGSARFSAVALDARGAPIEAARVTWAVAPFDAAWADGDGTIHGVRQGEVRVMAIVDGRIGFATLDVGPKPPASVELEVASGRIVVGDVSVVTATPRTEDGEPVRDAPVRFRSSDERVATVGAGGTVIGRSPGEARILATSGEAVGELRVEVIENPVAAMEVSGPAEARTGDVVYFRARASDLQGRSLADPPIRWSVSGEGAAVHPDGGFVAERPGTYLVSGIVGRTTATAPITVRARVHGRTLETVASRVFPDVSVAEHWAIGDVLYVSTILDRLYTFDIRDPSNPVLVDSVMVDAHVINDVATTPDGRIGVITREGASSRRNGIVFLDLADPLRPGVLSEFTETVTGGVHSIYIDGHHVYLTDDATGSMRVIDFSDPRAPRQVARWQVPAVEGVGGTRDPETGDVYGLSVGRMLHDLQVLDGLAYLAYWRHGVVILDVGAGIAGGSPEDPRLVSRFTYNVADYYPPDRIAGTHTVFRYGDYLFIADEVFPGMFDLGARDRIETMGMLHVLDVSDIRNPRKVAEYAPPITGVHNVWVRDDVLYMGAFEAGLRALDVSGELRGDLRAQGREIGAVWTGSPQGFRPNLPMAWGAQPHREHIYVTDMNSGVWVARLTPAPIP